MIWLTAAFASPPTATDLVQLRWISGVQRAGDQLYFVSGSDTLDAEDGWSETAHLMALSVQGGTPRRMTLGDDGPYGFSPSPSGDRLVFVRDGSIQVLPTDGGEALPIATTDLEPEQVLWSSDGTHLLFLATPEPEVEPEVAHRTGEAHRFEIAERTRLYRVSAAGGEPEELTDGSFTVLDLAEHGGTIALVTAAEANAYEASMATSLSLLIDGEITSIQESGCAESLAFSPDGNRLAWVGCTTGLVGDSIHTHDLRSATTLNILESSDPTVYGYQWMPNGKAVLATVAVGTLNQLWNVPTTGAPPRVVHQAASISDVTIGPRGKTVHLLEGMSDHPDRLQALDLKGKRSSLLWDPNPQISGWTLPTTEVVTWDSPEANELEGILRLPADRPDKPPLIVLPHGGPDGVSSTAFRSLPLFLASQGYAVFQPNYRGGIAYGRDFYAANRGRLGDIEFMDIESGVDQLIEDGRVSPTDLHYGGWSWGGYLTAWTIGHTDRYRSAVAGAAVVDTVAQYVGSDINHGIAADWEYNGRPWSTPERFAAANPRRSLQNIKTPTLILHGDADVRAPFQQGVTLYRALSDIGTDVEFWVYPDEGHGLSDPAHKVHRLETWLGWVQRHDQRTHP